MTPLAVIDENALFRRGLRVGLEEAGFPVEESQDLVAWARLGGERAAIVTTSGPDELARVTQARTINPEVVAVVITEKPTARSYSEALKAGATAFTVTPCGARGAARRPRSPPPALTQRL